jgi:hypothetical protein
MVGHARPIALFRAALGSSVGFSYRWVKVSQNPTNGRNAGTSAGVDGKVREEEEYYAYAEDR